MYVIYAVIREIPSTRSSAEWGRRGHPRGEVLSYLARPRFTATAATATTQQLRPRLPRPPNTPAVTATTKHARGYRETNIVSMAIHFLLFINDAQHT